MKKELLLREGARAIVIVAHPDDETIWMGGTILANPRIDWTIFSLCRLSDDDRRPKFRRVCRHYGARSIMADLDDEGRIGLDESVEQIVSLIKQKLKGRSYDYVFTHGANGDYGHERHIGAHRAVKKLVQENYFPREAVFYFCYEKNKRPRPAMIPRRQARYIYSLKNKLYLEKRRIVAKMHGYPEEGIDVNLCTRTEAFVN